MNRRGYTLVEMLISLVLVVTLMSAAFGLTSLYNRFLTAGRSRAMSQQIARSLFQLIDDDIDQATLPVQPRQTRAEPTPENFNRQSSSSLETASEEPSGSAEQGSGVFSGFMNELSRQNLNLPPLEFIGSATELRMTVVLPVDSRPVQTVTTTDQPVSDRSAISRLQSSFQSGSETGLETDTTRLVTIVYQFHAPGLTTELDQQLAAGLHRIEIPTLQLRQLTSSSQFEQTASSDRRVAGSNEINRFTLEALLAPPDPLEALRDEETEALPRPSHEHIAEVVHFEFEYFDGAGWESSWSTADALPTAIRVRFGLVTQDDLKTIATVFAAATEQSEVATTLATDDGAIDPLAAIKPRRFERILLLSSEDPPEATFGDDFTGAFP